MPAAEPVCRTAHRLGTDVHTRDDLAIAKVMASMAAHSRCGTQSWQQ